jgi:predicted alpha/beta-hydrolase family hydrolase
VTKNDWRTLGTTAAAALQLPVARAAFSHLADEAALALLQRVQQQWLAGASHDLCTAEVLAYQVTKVM